MKDDVTVALNVLAENLRRATSEDANFKALLVSALNLLAKLAI